MKNTSISYHVKSQTETWKRNFFGENVKSKKSHRKNEAMAENGINKMYHVARSLYTLSFHTSYERGRHNASIRI